MDALTEVVRTKVWRFTAFPSGQQREEGAGSSC